MKKITLNIEIEEYRYDELSDSDLNLVTLAREATYRSYAPYSNFKVGAAIRLDNGEIIEGANQENVAYPSGTCAERSACFYAHAQYPKAKFVEIAIAARGTDDEFVPDPIAPCGACRQALLEYELLAGHDVPVLLAARDRVYRIPSVRALLPVAFTDF
ncbi:MAG: cytidine deaminase [Muribaculaceae bacterium]|nr:cytidine deaminase [Muribaculaceae bacterium]